MTQMTKTMKPTLGPAVPAILSTAVVLAVMGAGAWVIAYGFPQGEAAGWWVLVGTLLLLVIAVVSFRYVDPRRMSLLKKCLVVSVLLHVLIAFFFSAVEVTKQVARYLRNDPVMTPAVNLQLSREMEVREQVRQQIQELPTINETPAVVAQQVDSPLPEMGPRIEAVGIPGAELKQLATSRNPVAPSIPQAAAAPELINPLLPVRPELAPVTETTPLPSPTADVSKESTRFPGVINEQLARATSPLPGIGLGELTAPPASLAHGGGGGGSATGSGTGKPFSLWDGKVPAPKLPEKAPDTVTTPPPPPAVPEAPQVVDAGDLTPQRSFDRRQDQLQKTGGTPETEAAVARALVYLSKMQYPDGHWTKVMDKPGGRTTDAHDTALTGLSVLCYLAAGNTPDKEGPYQDTVKRGIGYLMAREEKNGDLRGDGNMYDQGIATLALGEAAAMTKGKQGAAIKDAAHRAAQFIVEAQNGAGGWRYTPRDLTSDASVLGWQALALHSAERSGFVIPAETRRKAFTYLDSVSTGKHGMLTGYLLSAPTTTMTAESIFTRMLLGQKLNAAQLDEASDFVMRKLPAKDNLNYYYIYYGSLALMQMQGDDWERWNKNTSRLLLNLQDREGQTTGSWDPEDSEWGERGGRIYTTTLATLTLEVYYRYLPMYSKKK
jgi:hypothetical protein